MDFTRDSDPVLRIRVICLIRGCNFFWFRLSEAKPDYEICEIRGSRSSPMKSCRTQLAYRAENYSRTVNRLRNQAGLPKDLVLYLARHACGTKTCKARGIECVRRLLGHTNISTIQRYVHLDGKVLAEAQDMVD